MKEREKVEKYQAILYLLWLVLWKQFQKGYEKLEFNGTADARILRHFLFVSKGR